ncbi:cytochrome P450 [Peniophora sp. CONT]|nr:cytochrome P450 [Peniophora sp. CONT]
MPRRRERETFSRWALQYGEIVHLQVLNKHIILLNSTEATNALLDKRSAIYSDRPHFPLFDVAGHGFNFGFLSYGKAWTTRRRTFANHFSRSSPDVYSFHSTAVMSLLRNLFTHPNAFMEHVQLHASQLIIGVTYGLDVRSCDDTLVRLSKAVMESMAIVVRPEMWIINPLLILDCLPGWLGGKYFVRQFQQWQADSREFCEHPYRLALQNDDNADCFLKQLLEQRLPSVNTQEHIVFSSECAASAYGGGSETTVAAGRTFFLAMAMNPAVQEKAFAEIEQVIGSGRLPNFKDRSNLPYISSIVREVLRWNPPVPLGIPHLVREDDEYNGYYLPKGSIIVGNIWHIQHDPAIFERPSEFMPERHLLDGSLIPDDSSRIVFGFGRRLCPGKAFAEDSLWLLVAQVLAVFAITPSGTNPIQAQFTSGTFSHPLPFECDIKPRSKERLGLLQTSG